MSVRYACVADASVVELFAGCTKRDREQLLRIFSALSNDPFQRGDYLQKSAAGRELQVKRFGKWLITYWSDHPVSELRIVDVRKIAG